MIDYFLHQNILLFFLVKYFQGSLIVVPNARSQLIELDTVEVNPGVNTTDKYSTWQNLSSVMNTLLRICKSNTGKQIEFLTLLTVASRKI